ncbi:hypothetical protein [Salinactinospora qingdaonensis]|uniref:hypothetical protein n=1 Tax=Salinactinospora qingdaonensis TaxID=702744 RepID=UPI0031E5F0C5
MPSSDICRVCVHPACRTARAARLPRRWGRSIEYASEHARAADLQQQFPGTTVWWGERSQTYRAVVPGGKGVLESSDPTNMTTLLRVRTRRPSIPSQAAAPRPESWSTSRQQSVPGAQQTPPQPRPAPTESGPQPQAAAQSWSPPSVPGAQQAPPPPRQEPEPQLWQETKAQLQRQPEPHPWQQAEARSWQYSDPHAWPRPEARPQAAAPSWQQCQQGAQGVQSSSPLWGQQPETPLWTHPRGQPDTPPWTPPRGQPESAPWNQPAPQPQSAPPPRQQPEPRWEPQSWQQSGQQPQWEAGQWSQWKPEQPRSAPQPQQQWGAQATPQPNGQPQAAPSSWPQTGAEPHAAPHSRRREPTAADQVIHRIPPVVPPAIGRHAQRPNENYESAGGPWRPTY